MITLAFDTCFAACSAAVVETAADGGVAAKPQLLAHRYEVPGRGHAELLVPMFHDVLSEAGLSGLDRVDRVAITTGPGSFTGVRLGVAVARAFTVAKPLEIRSTTSLHLMAAGAAETLAIRHGTLTVAVDAKRDQIYVQRFDVIADLVRPVGSAAALRLDNPDDLASLANSDAIVGSGGPVWWAAHGAILADTPNEEAPPQRVLAELLPDARLLALMAARGETVTHHADAPPSPLYLRPPDAKPQVGKAIPRQDAPGASDLEAT